MSNKVVSCKGCWQDFPEPKYKREILLNNGICPACGRFGTLVEIDAPEEHNKHWHGGKNGNRHMDGNGKTQKRHTAVRIAV